HMLALLNGSVSNSLPTTNNMSLTNSLGATNSYDYILSYRVNHLPWLEGMVSWWPLDVDGTDIFGGFNGLLLGDVAFSTGKTGSFLDDCAGPLNPIWQPGLPSVGTGGAPTPIVGYAGVPSYTFTTVASNTVMRLQNTIGSLERLGWSSSAAFIGQSFRYETRFNTLTNPVGRDTAGFIEAWIIDAANTNRFDVISPYSGPIGGPTNQLLVGSSIDGSYNALSFVYQTNTWYRLAIYAAPGKAVRAAVLSDAGTELAGLSFNHGAAAFPAGFKIGLSQFAGISTSTVPVDVVVESVSVVSGLSGEVSQAYYGDGTATRMVVPGCPELDLGRGRGFSIEGWINPLNVTNFGPLAEWYSSAPATNQSPLGVQFWVALTNGPGSLGAIIWDTNQQPHVITTLTNAITNGGWQHVALTYDTNSGTAAIYVNGGTNSQPLVVSNLGAFFPRTSGDLYLGYDPAAVPPPINYSNFSSTAGLNLVGDAAQNGSVLRITPSAPSRSGGFWAINKQSCAAGFDTRFQFRISNAGSFPGTPAGGDGFAFTIQNIGPADSNFYAPPSAPGASISVFFNTFLNWPGCLGPQCDVSDNSVGVVSNGLYVAQVDLTPKGIDLKSGTAHEARVTFDGAALTVWVDGTMVLASIPVPGLASALDADGKAWVGFNAATGWAWENHDILNWTFGQPQSGTSFAGGLDEFSVYDRALTPCEVSAIFNAGSRGKYGTNVLVCPVVTEVTLSNSISGMQSFVFTNGLAWTNGPYWETNTISFTTGTNPTPIMVRGWNPFATNSDAGNNLNAVVDEFVLSESVPQGFDGLLYFSENTNLATIPIKFAPAPFVATNFPPILVFTNGFENATSGLYQAGSAIPGGNTSPAIGIRDWSVTSGPMTVVSNLFFDLAGTNYLAMSTGAVQCLLPTVAGHRYDLTYNLRGPCAVGWWDGSVNPLSGRARDLISGNDGAFLHGATNTAYAFVGRQGFFFSGQTEPPPAQDPDIFIEDIDDPSSVIELADPPQLRLT
ncbi:MAG: LamG-like jellyroll fold domain-containing protein, partial [Verrucomicrobiota bacterium]